MQFSYYQVVLNVPKLEHLFVGGTLCSFFVMKDLTSLVEATASFAEYNDLWLELLQKISRAKSLSLAKPDGVSLFFSEDFNSLIHVFSLISF